MGYAFFQDWQTNHNTEYITAENSTERVAEDIIRDVWGARSNRTGEDKSLTRVRSITSLPQVDGTLALDMRIHIEGATEHGVLIGFLDHSKKLFPKLASEEKLKGYNEFRLYGSIPMVDRNGNESEDNISKVFFTRKGIEAVDWNKDSSDLHFVFTRMNDGKNCTYWVHGGILAKISWLNKK